MQQVILKPLYHRQQECIGIFFEKNFKIKNALQETGIATFSITNSCWYSPLNKESYNKIVFALKGKAVIENKALHQYLADKKKTTHLPAISEK